MFEDRNSLLKVTIKNNCETEPKHAKLGPPSGKFEIQWHAPTGTFVLHLPGGVFIGKTEPFELTISGPDFLPEPPLALAPSPAKGTYPNYISANGPCPLVDVPDIIVE